MEYPDIRYQPLLPVPVLPAIRANDNLEPLSNSVIYTPLLELIDIVTVPVFTHARVSNMLNDNSVLPDLTDLSVRAALPFGPDGVSTLMIGFCGLLNE